MKKIDEMSDIEIFNFIRDKRKWMVEILTRKSDLEKKFNFKISDHDWELFRYMVGSHLNELGEYAFEDLKKIKNGQKPDSFPGYKGFS